MSYKVIAIESFKHEAKKLSKKYPSLKDDLVTLLTELEKHPDMGVPIGNHCFKIRLAIKSKNRGKSGGARVITNFAVIESTVFLLSIYDKSTMESISDEELKNRLSQLPE